MASRETEESGEPTSGVTESPLRVAVTTLGCKVNRVESESIAAELLGCGVAIVDEDDAEVVILNTCSVTAEADRKARKAVRHALKSGEHPVVVVTGCSAAHDPSGLQALSSRVIVELDKDAVARRVAAEFALSAPETAGAALALPLDRSGAAFRTRAMLKIQDGCDNFCTYCIVAHLRGEPRSVPFARIEAQARSLTSGGTAEIVLTGINIGRYADAIVGARLPDVIRAVAAAGARRVRVSSIEPPDVGDAVLSALAETPGACPHLHIPLQSGSDRVLAAMGRHYDAATFVDIVDRARAAVPTLGVTTDVMVGFPGEREDDIADTLRVIERAGLSRLHVFRFSPRPGTPAAEMDDQVAAAEKADRSVRVRKLGERLAEVSAAARVGSVATMLVETVSDDGSAEGTTEDYRRVRASGSSLRPGDLVEVRLTDAVGAQLVAEVSRIGMG